jgi:TM2 domain-containing membrane protein YozV
VIYCQDHVPVPVYTAQPAGGPGATGSASYTQTGSNPYAPPTANPYAQSAPPGVPAHGSTSPALAFILGWIPGVGAIYNGQYLKGLVHAIIFGLLISLVTSADGSASQPFLIMTMVGFIFYMPFEAYHTARRRQLGVPVDEWSSLTGSSRFSSRVPIAPILLIALGVLFLLDTLHLIEFREIGRFWPIILIVVGVIMLYGRITGLRSHRTYTSTASVPDHTGDQVSGGQL